MRAEIGATASEFHVEGCEILHPIGCGGMGQVFLARQLPLGRLVALKVLAIDAGDHSQERIVRFRREAELMAGLSHPNVLPVFQYGESAGRPYLILEYVPHGDLRRIMPEGCPMPADKVTSILRPVADALSYLHSRGILHRDLKPENILMHEGVLPKVADFGVAVSLVGSASLTKTGHRIGTIGYVAPEQHYQLEVDERADQFSLAALAYEMLTGQRALGICKPPSSHNPKLGAGVDAVILRGLQELPRDRYASVLEFASALEASLDKPTDSPGRKIDPAILWTLALAPVLLAGAWLMRPGPPPHWPHQPPPLDGKPLGANGDVAPATSNVPPPANPPVQVEKSPAFRELTALRAIKIWEQQGKKDLPKEKSDANWFEAEKQVEKAVADRAYSIWEKQGALKGWEGEARREANRKQAEQELLEAARAGRPF